VVACSFGSPPSLGVWWRGLVWCGPSWPKETSITPFLASFRDLDETQWMKKCSLPTKSIPSHPSWLRPLVEGSFIHSKLAYKDINCLDKTNNIIQHKLIRALLFYFILLLLLFFPPNNPYTHHPDVRGIAAWKGFIPSWNSSWEEQAAARLWGPPPIHHHHQHRSHVIMILPSQLVSSCCWLKLQLFGGNRSLNTPPSSSIWDIYCRTLLLCRGLREGLIRVAGH
jgi:hypothetical protein